MSLHRSTLHRLVEEMQPLEGCRIQKITQPSTREVVLQLRRPGETLHLLLALQAGQERLHLVEKRPPSLPAPPLFCMVLRKHLLNGILVATELVPEHRIVQLTILRGSTRWQLYAELIPRHGNCVLCENGLISQSLSSLAPLRTIRRGDSWEPPPLPPNHVSREEAPPEPSAPFDEERQTFWEYAETHREVSGRYAVRTAKDRLQTMKRLALRSRRARLKKLQRLLTNLERDRERCEEALSLEQDAELLKGNLHLIKRGDEAIEVVDYFDPEMNKRILTLDPAMSPQDNLAKLFKRIKRARKGLASIAPRVDSTEEIVLQLMEEVETIESIQELDALMAYLPETEQESARQKRKQQGSVPYREYRSSNGHRIWVGRNSKANDEMTFHLAKGNDIWLHTRGLPGSHILIPLVKGQSPPHETLLDAAILAMHFSKAREETFAEIMHTQAKYVRKIKGTPPGQVQVIRDHNMTIRRDPERLERLLASLETKP